MKEHLKYFFPFILGAILFLLGLNYCKKNSTKTDVIINKNIDSTIIYVKDTNTHTHNTTNIYTNPIFTVNPGNYVDTAKIIKMYFTKYFATDTLRDTLINLVVNDTLFNNQITYRNYQYKLIKPYQVIKSYTITNTINAVKGFYIGGFTSINTKLNTIGINAFYFKNKNGFGTGYDVLNKSIQFNYLYKIGK